MMMNDSDLLGINELMKINRLFLENQTLIVCAYVTKLRNYLTKSETELRLISRNFRRNRINNYLHYILYVIILYHIIWRVTEYVFKFRRPDKSLA